MNIVLIGAKASGKSTLGKELSDHLGLQNVETDEILESLYNEQDSSSKKCHEIFDLIGEEEFRKFEFYFMLYAGAIRAGHVRVGQFLYEK